MIPLAIKWSIEFSEGKESTNFGGKVMSYQQLKPPFELHIGGLMLNTLLDFVDNTIHEGARA